MFIIDSCIEICEDDSIPYKVYGIYNSKELAIKALNELNKYLQDNYADNIISVWNVADGFAVEFSYIEPGDTDYKQYASLYYEVRELSTPDSILNTTPNGIGTFIHKIMFPDND